VRFLSKVVCLAAGLFAIGLASSSVRANDLAMGSFTLHHAARWNSTTLPAGDYTFRVARTPSNTNLMMIRGEKQSLTVFVYGESDCRTCQSSSLNLEARGENSYVTSMDLAGYHMNFKINETARAREEEMAKTRARSQSQQMAVHTDDSNN
jgi:predicted carbohydrate-binding protein with CBM5 and CBM33 domain